MFQLEASDGAARAGTVSTLHGTIQTPAFMPVGTRATVRGQTVVTLREVGAQVLLANTWHLLLRPGPDVFQRVGGIHRFMSWPRPVLTDSGGFQVFSLGAAITEEGASFVHNGRTIVLSPETSIATQRAIGSDIMMAMDQCVPSTLDRAQAADALARTTRWARRSLAARAGSSQALFGIVQGACFGDLRAESAAQITELPFDGYAIGGLAVGETRAEREDTTALTAPLLPADKPRYLMGVGTPIDLLEAVRRGVDLFDCILPTAMAQQGVVYTATGRLELRRGVYRTSEDALDRCSCSTCTTYSRAYLHHLVRSSEVLAWQLLGTHNLHFYHRLMSDARAAILGGRFDAFYRDQRPQLDLRDPEHPVTPPRPKRDRHRMEEGNFEVVVSGEVGHLRQRSSGEVMHPGEAPAEEAQRLYVAQSRLAARLADPGPPLVVWDVGLGAASNAMAAIAAAGARPLELISFENDLDALRLALRHPGYFPHLRHAAPNALLRDGAWTRDTVRWRLIVGDFATTLDDAPSPDVVFYDPFSSRADAPLWSFGFFRRLFERCRDTELFTYSNATPVRAALLAAGFWVARGESSGAKGETTVAATRPIPNLLGAEWLGRLARSTRPAPPEVTDIPGFIDAVRRHPQFA
jgi:queuine tRNA-ribosyltransferase